MRIFENPWALPAVIVLAVVIILYLLIKSRSNSDETKAEDMEVHNSINNSSKEVRNNTGALEEDLALVAAIMAAISAFSGKSPSELNIKSIRRVDSSESSWRREAISNSVRR